MKPKTHHPLRGMRLAPFCIPSAIAAFNTKIQQISKTCMILISTDRWVLFSRFHPETGKNFVNPVDPV
jgi:hypothetical protein